MGRRFLMRFGLGNCKRKKFKVNLEVRVRALPNSSDLGPSGLVCIYLLLVRVIPWEWWRKSRCRSFGTAYHRCHAPIFLWDEVHWLPKLHRRGAVGRSVRRRRPWQLGLSPLVHLRSSPLHPNWKSFHQQEEIAIFCLLFLSFPKRKSLPFLEL